MQELMTVEEVAQYLRVAERTIYDWAQKGDIPCGKIGNAWRFRRSDIDQWVNQKFPRPHKLGGVPQLSLDLALTPERAVLLDAKTKNQALHSLIDVLASAEEVRDRDGLAEGIFHREALMSTGIGLGVAVPHVRLDSVTDIAMAAGLCLEPLTDYESLDGDPVRLIFMIAAGREQHAKHIRLLSLISSRVKQTQLREALLLCRDRQSFFALLTGAEPDSLGD